MTTANQSEPFSRQLYTGRGLIAECMKQFPGWLTTSVVLGLLSALASGLSITMVAPLLAELLGQDIKPAGTSRTIHLIVDLIHSIPSQNRLFTIGGAIILLMGIKNVLFFWNMLGCSELTRLAVNSLRERTLNILMHADLGFISSVAGPGPLVQHALKQVDEAAKSITSLGSLLSSALTVAVFTIILMFISFQLTIASIALFVLIFSINHQIVKRARRESRESVKESNSLSAAMYEAFSGIRLVKATVSEERERKKLLGISKKQADVDYIANVLAAAQQPLTEFTAVLALVLIILMGRIFVPVPEHSFPTALITFLFVLLRVVSLISSINGRRIEIVRLMASADALAAFLSQDIKVEAHGGTPYSTLQQAIEFKDVCFRYKSDSERLILKNLSFTLPRGKVTALVGESGSGKSTIADLLCRYYKNDSGQILLDGKEISTIDPWSLRANIGVVNQDTFLFNNTIAYNISYGRENVTEDQIIQAAKKAHAWVFIERLPNGIHTVIGERGSQLSAGERQRIAIARIILQDPDIVILDEATSALDTISEKLVQQALDALLQDRTALIIAHRLATIQKAHQIAVLDQGEIIETGKHEQLFASNGRYRKMCEVGSLLLVGMGSNSTLSAQEAINDNVNVHS